MCSADVHSFISHNYYDVIWYSVPHPYWFNDTDEHRNQGNIWAKNGLSDHVQAEPLKKKKCLFNILPVKAEMGVHKCTHSPSQDRSVRSVYS